MRRRRTCITLIAMAVIVTSCGGNSDGSSNGSSGGDSGRPEAPPLIRMGWGIPEEEIKYVMQSNPEVARNLGTCYEIEWHQFAGTVPGVQGLAAGTLDGATVGGLSVAHGIDQGADIVITGEFIEERASGFSTAYMVPEDIKTPEDLAGKTVSTVAVGASTDYIQDFYIEREAGLLPDRDYKKVEVPFGQQVEGIQAGQFAMGTYPQPFYTQMQAAGGFRTLFRVTDLIDPFVQLLQGFRRDFVDENPEAVRCFMEDFASVAEYIVDPANRDAVIAASSEATQIPQDVLRQFLLTDADFFRPERGAISVDALQSQWDFFRDQGGISQDLKVEDYLIDDSITSRRE
jgi:ABC-type nitrate/sulfonate/bicarbonate transport system substrate-binding protein